MFKSTHNLEYLQSDKATDLGEGRVMNGFKVGTCHGLFYQTKEAVCILAIANDDIGNGHFTDVLDWFEYSAKRQGLYLDVVEIWNQPLKWHLINKRGFFALEYDHVRKDVCTSTE